MKRSLFLALFGFVLTACASDFYYDRGEKVEVTKTSQTRAVNDQNVSYYITEKGHKVGVTNDVIVKCESAKSCVETLHKKGFKQVSQLSSTLFLVRLERGEDVFKVAQKLHEDSEIKFAQPNFLKEKIKR
ncbi:MAG: hypothetical protein K0U47_11755 [Epsilonproteobacteria bacterium]|nr:hypothetical protein [Campylobacterota bacterium]